MPRYPDVSPLPFEVHVRRLLIVRLIPALVALSIVAHTSSAQTVDALAEARAQWKSQIVNITKAAEELTDAEYAYKPVKTVRSFGDLVGHVAGTQDMICAAVLGEKQPAEDAIEKSAKTKAALVAALKASTAHCDKAYAIPASQLGAMIDMFGDKSTKFGALTLNAVHDGEHYGNIVTYMRMQGKVPPSSKK